MILLTGATGTVGREVARLLGAEGAGPVRVMARDAARASRALGEGFETVEGDFERPETLGAALEGVERAFLLTPPSPHTFEHQATFIEAAKRAGVSQVVKVSAIGASTSAPGGFAKWHGQADEALTASGLGYTILQPNFFMQNLLGQAAQVAAQGVIYQPGGDAAASMIDARDIAKVAARALTEDGHEGKTYVLTGPEALTYTDVARKLSQATGRGVSYVSITPEQFREGALAHGLPPWLVDALALLNDFFAEGKAAAVTDDVRRVARDEPITFDQFARDHAEAFRG
jgi:uncharacterized protein YbjT (DUF2867 family)